MKFGYYPGCSLLGSAEEYARSAEGVLEAVGVELAPIDDWVCCGATAAHATSHLLAVALPAISCAAEPRVFSPGFTAWLMSKFWQKTQRRLHSALHGTTESNAADQLIANALCYQFRVDFRLADFDDVQGNVTG
ncbi:hypothetical protein LCGC14_2395490 [marine sediment metagenome]|uniref:Cysteine-rich domain-containing protein n=1 Tax=marine sediment metagenome TaxID=412755 RepID=A0A0F9CIZ9_9ZZZZ